MVVASHWALFVLLVFVCFLHLSVTRVYMNVPVCVFVCHRVWMSACVSRGNGRRGCLSLLEV